MEALVTLGTVPAWKTVARYVPNRTGTQCRNRYNKVIKKASHWKDALKGVVFKHAVDCEALKATPVAEAVVPLRIEVPPPCEETTDAFSFESMHALGALPHLAQPVPNVMPSPDSMKQLPRCPTPLPLAPRASAFVPRIVPVDGCRKPQPVSLLSVVIVPTLDADLLRRLPATRRYVTTGRALQHVNDMLGASPKKRPKLRAAAERSVEGGGQRVVEGVVFNGRLVSAV